MDRRTRTIIVVLAAVAVCAAAAVVVWSAGVDRAAGDGIRAVLKENKADLLALEGVVSVAVAEQAGEEVIAVVVDPDTPVSTGIPGSIDGYMVVTASPASTGDAPVSSGGGSSGSTGGAGSSGVAPGATGGGAGTEPAQPIEPGAGGSDGAADQPGQSTGLDLRGTVTSVGVVDLASSTQDVVGVLLVEGSQDTDALYDTASVTVTADTTIWGQVDGHVAEIHPSLEDLEGAEVEVGFTGPVRESYPVQATAAWITVL